MKFKGVFGPFAKHEDRNKIEMCEDPEAPPDRDCIVRKN